MAVDKLRLSLLRMTEGQIFSEIPDKRISPALVCRWGCQEAPAYPNSIKGPVGVWGRRRPHRGLLLAVRRAAWGQAHIVLVQTGDEAAGLARI